MRADSRVDSWPHLIPETLSFKAAAPINSPHGLPKASQYLEAFLSCFSSLQMSTSITWALAANAVQLR